MNILSKKETGVLGERITEEYLRKNGFNIIDTNYRTGPGEIDIIAQKGTLIVFVEVKTRSSDIYGKPGESIDFSKIDRIRRAALTYLNERKSLSRSVIRFDVISLEIDKKVIGGLMQKNIENSVLISMYKEYSHLEHIEDAF